MKRVLRAGFKVLLGLGLGLALAELAFRVRDDFAFPHVNFYLPDDALGVTLEPNATERLAFTGNPATTLHTNSRGFRGGEWPAPVAGELIVVGDSQVFGLGVEDDETVPAQLAKLAGRQVLNAGVPTYGPREYLALAKRLVAERPQAGVVLVFNVANDFFELERPNLTRHAVWNGWAVRKENLPDDGAAFPGERWLNSRSHLVFAWRRLQLERRLVRGNSETLAEFGANERDLGTASEGNWRDLLTASEKKERVLARPPVAIPDPTEPLRERAKTETDELSALEDLDTGIAPFSNRAPDFAELVLSKQAGDVVRDTGSEMARSIPVTAELLEKAALHRQRLAELRRNAELEAVKRRAMLEKTYAELDALRWTLPSPAAEEVVGASFLDELAAFGREHEVTLVVLPLDVQVSSSEWEKYGAPPRDLEATLELNRALTAAARRKGLRAIDPLPALRAAEPGAFLHGDLHLTTKGIAAVATAVRDGLSAPPGPGPELPDGVTPLPSPAEWSAVGENTVKGSTAARCETKQVREWLRVRCRHAEDFSELASGVRFIEGRRGEQQLMATQRGASVVVPVRPGARAVVGFRVTSEGLRERERQLTVDWPKGAEAARLELGKPQVVSAASWIELVDRRVGDCEAELAGPDSVAWGNWEPRSSCFAFPDCLRLLACLQGHPFARPRCESGWVNAGPDGRCLPKCESDRDCQGVFDWGIDGTCSEWLGQRVCL